MRNFDIFGHLKNVCVIKNGEVIFEYTRENEKGTLLFPIGCIFKSFLSVLAGIAIYEGKIGSIDDCVIDYISHEKIADMNWYRLKIKHALSKTTGITWPIFLRWYSGVYTVWLRLVDRKKFGNSIFFCKWFRRTIFDYYST